MLFVYRPHASTGARVLAEALGGRRIKDWHRLRPQGADRLVCWGATVPQVSIPAAHILNGAPLRNKLADAEALAAAGVSTVATSRTKPAERPTAAPPRPPDPAAELIRRAQELAVELSEVRFEAYTRPAPLPRGIQQLMEAAEQAATALGVDPPAQPPAPPAAPRGEWVARSANHVGGTDLLRGIQQGDYWVKKETFVAEYRVHSFLGRSIRAGKKIPRTGFASPHAWVRSWDGGWCISYDGESVRQRHREIAHRAVAALNLQFGAVDIGEKADGSLVVLEVNRAPGLEGGTIEAYKRAIQSWAGAAR